MQTPISSKNRLISFSIQATVFFLIVIFLLELIARTPWAQRTFQYRSVGNFDYQFEIKWFRLQDYVKQNGGVDVILLGSSLVNTGLDPLVMAQTYYQKTGLRLRIFNFGVEGLSVSPNSINARILVNKYHPALLLYVTEMRDYIASAGLEYEQPFLANPWVRYEAGEWNLAGWLSAHSMALQYFLPYRNWMRSDFPPSIYALAYRSHDTSPEGYEPEYAQASNVGSPPDPHDPNEAKFFNEYGNYRAAPSRLKNLQDILALQGQAQVKIMVVEMPVHPTFYAYVGGDSIHRQFQEELSSIVDSAGAYFVPAETCSDIPLNGRANRWHLNYMGAEVFSRCLSGELVYLNHQTGIDFIHDGGNGSP